MMGLQKINKCVPTFILFGFLFLALCVSGCLSIFEWNIFDYTWNRNVNIMTITVTGDLRLQGSADSTNWTGHRHAYEAFQFPDTWTGENLATTYQVYKVKSPSDSLMKSSTITWHTSKAVAEMAESKTAADRGNTYRGFESDSTISWSDISALVGPQYRIHYVSTLTISSAPSLGPKLCGQILGDQMDRLWSGRSFIVDGQTPTLTQWGIIIMITLIVGSAVFIMLKRRKATVPA